jgi:hypothetical protein
MIFRYDCFTMEHFPLRQRMTLTTKVYCSRLYEFFIMSDSKMIDKDAIGTVLNCILCCITLSFRGNSTLNNSVFLTLNSLHNNNNINRTLQIVVTRSTKIGTLLSTKHLMPRAAV